MRGRGVQLRTPDDLAYLDRGSILHWEFRHFVVLERAEKKGAWVLDPGKGRMFVTRAQLDRALTGVALAVEPGPEFEPEGASSLRAPAETPPAQSARTPAFVRPRAHLKRR